MKVHLGTKMLAEKSLVMALALMFVRNVPDSLLTNGASGFVLLVAVVLAKVSEQLNVIYRTVTMSKAVSIRTSIDSMPCDCISFLQNSVRFGRATTTIRTVETTI